MKILVISSWYPTTANPLHGIFVKEQVKALIRGGLDVEVLHANFSSSDFHFNNVLSFSEEEGIPTFRASGFVFPKVNMFFINRWVAKYRTLFEKYIKRKGLPDLIHAHSYLAGYVAMNISEFYNIPFVVTEHLSRLINKSPKNRHHFLIQKTYDRAAKVIAVSEILKTKLSAFTNNEIVVIPNFIDLDLFKPRQKAPPEIGKELTFIGVGNLIPRKGFDLLIHAFSHFLKKEKIPGKLIIVGEGAEKRVLEKLIKISGLSERVVLTGSKNQRALVEILHESDVFVCSSHHETFGIVMIEAMAMGLPVVATKCGGSEEIVTEATGLLVSRNSVDALAEGMGSVARNLDHYKKEEIRNHICRNYDSANVVAKIEQLYRSVLEKPA